MESDLGALPHSELDDSSSDELTAKQQPRINRSRTKGKSKKTHADGARRKGGRTKSSKKMSDENVPSEDDLSSDDEEDSSSWDSGNSDSDDEVAAQRSGRNHRSKQSTQPSQQRLAQPRSSQARTTENDPSPLPPQQQQQQMAFSYQHPQFMPPPQPSIYNNPSQEHWRLPQGQDHPPAEQLRFLDGHAHPPMDRLGFPPNQVSSPAEQLRCAPQSMAQPFSRPDPRAPPGFMATRPRPPDGLGQYSGMMSSQPEFMSMLQNMIEGQLMARQAMQPSTSGPATSKSRESTARSSRKPVIKETSHRAKARRSQKLEYKRLDQGRSLGVVIRKRRSSSSLTEPFLLSLGSEDPQFHLQGYGRRQRPRRVRSLSVHRQAPVRLEGKIHRHRCQHQEFASEDGASGCHGWGQRRELGRGHANGMATS